MDLWGKIQGSAHHPEPFAPALSCHASSRHTGRDEKPCGRGRETDNQAYCMVVYHTSWIISQELLTEAKMVVVCCRTSDLISVFGIYQCSHNTWGRGTPKIQMWAPFIPQKNIFNHSFACFVKKKKLKCLEFFICGPLECNQWEL